MTEIKESKFNKNNYYIKAFFWGTVLAVIMFIPFIVYDGGRFLFYGDFNAQQIPFYMLAHEQVWSGNLGWSHLTDLGANFIGSYSFYLLGSPFFWLTMPFPQEVIPYLMAPLLILKFGCASLGAYTYLQRYVKDKRYALVGALIYAFSGYSIYNIFFNHFHEAIVIFPFLLAALDEYVETKKRGIVALCICAACIFNYYFFVGQAIFCVIYFVVKVITGRIKISIADFLLLALECILGLGMACVLFVPSVLTILQNSRVDNPINGWNALVYDRSQRYLHIIQSMFFPPDLPARPNFTPDSNSKWASIGMWLPLFGMTGTIAWINQKRKSWLKLLITILFICAFIPFLNSMFQLFNSSYYARWFYMLTLVLSLATVMSLESTKVDWKKAIKLNTIIVAFISITIGFMPVCKTKDGVDTWSFGLEDYPTRFWSYVAIVLICLAILVYIFRYVNAENRARKFFAWTAVISVVYGMFFVALGKTQTEDPYKHIIPYALNGGEDLPNLEHLNTARSDFYESLDNSGMYWQIPTINAFHSVVPGSIMEFYDYIGINRSVGSRPEVDELALRALTSVKWLFDDEDDSDYFGGENYDTPLMEGFVYYGNANGFDIWENENYVPMGFSYDYYLLESEMEELSEASRQKAMLQAVIISDVEEELWSAHASKMETEDLNYTTEEYLQNCAELKANACETFEYTDEGFFATYSSVTDDMVFFSVPYEDGWSAYVNGEKVKISKTNIGFMSVPVKAGDSVFIEFIYTTPGLGIGMLITIISAGVLFLYLVTIKKIDAKRKAKIRIIRKRKVGSFKEYCQKMNIQLPTKE